MEELDRSEEERIRHRRARIAQMKAEKKRRERIQRRIRAALFLGVPAILIIAVVVVVINIVAHNIKGKKVEAQTVADSGEAGYFDSEGVWHEEVGYTDEQGNYYDGSGGYYDVNGNYYDAEGNLVPSEGRPHPESAYVEKHPEKDYPFVNRKKPDEDGMIQVGDVMFKAGYSAENASSVISPPEEISQSTYSILINENTGEIIASRNPRDRMYPASMTKVMTLLVAVENIKTLDDTIYVSQEAADWSYSNDGSAVNWSVGEKLTVKDLLYGTILSSGADACYDLAQYVSGSQEAFVDLMNEKVAELGLSETTHFTNCAGFYDDNHYTTPYDMAMIMKAAVENDLCREVMSAHTYTTPLTEEHPEGILISNWFLRRIEDKDSGGFVMCAKTGFVNQSGNCAVSYMISNGGVPYICVTGHAHSGWRAIYDHVGLYYNYTK